MPREAPIEIYSTDEVIGSGHRIFFLRRSDGRFAYGHTNGSTVSIKVPIASLRLKAAYKMEHRFSAGGHLLIKMEDGWIDFGPWTRIDADYDEAPKVKQKKSTGRDMLADFEG